MQILELVCLGIVTTYVLARLRQATDRGQRLAFLTRFAVLAVASFVGEDTVIRAYGFYAYATGWSARLDHVPLVIVLVWPVVIDSAATLARALVSGSSRASSVRVATLGAAIVLADASLIEPIAVRAGLWRWVEPGLFGVPLIGIVGWAFFAWATIMVFELAGGSGGSAGSRAKYAVIVIAPLATHALILASWWIVFRWASGDRSAIAAAGLAWGLSAVVAARVARDGARDRGLALVPIAELLVRLPGALFFFVLLGATASAPSAFAAPDGRAYASPDPGLLALVAYAAAFAPPYLTALTLRAARKRSGALA